LKYEQKVQTDKQVSKEIYRTIKVSASRESGHGILIRQNNGELLSKAEL